MNKAIGTYVFIAFLIFSKHALSFNDESSTCNLKTPPSASGINAGHGVIYYVYPRELTPKFTGCQILWDHNGDIKVRIEFSNGKVKNYSEYESSNAPPSFTCKYDNKTSSENSADCPEPDAAQRGLNAIPQDEEINIPKFNDLRK